MASGKFVIESNRFREFDRKLENAVERALERGGEVGKAAAEAKPLRGYRIAGIVGSARVGKPQKGRKGLEIDIVWQDFRTLFFEKGTYQNRRGKLKRERKSTSANRGVKPVRFMLAARKAGTDKLLDLIRAEMR